LSPILNLESGFGYKFIIADRFMIEPSLGHKFRVDTAPFIGHIIFGYVF
jgi:hypothetical protein